MLNKKIFFDKNNTIFYSSYLNSGVNPVSSLVYGSGYSRFIFHFDETPLKELYNNKTCPDISKFNHKIKIYNAGGISNDNDIAGREIYDKIRAVDTDLILFPLQQDFTEGIGVDYSNDGFGFSNTFKDTNGSNWFNSSNNTSWTLGEGSFSGNTSGITISETNLPTGTEIIEFDITNWVNGLILSGNTNYGLCLSYKYELEQITNLNKQKYLGLFTRHTNTIFKPYLETTYNNTISDDRANFFLNKNNKLYLYSNINSSEGVNLDYIPSCDVVDRDDNVIASYTAVTQETKGVYSIDLTITGNDSETMYYDKWSNIYINGIQLPDVELDFTTKPHNKYFNIGVNKSNNKNYIIDVSNIGNNESILMGEVRKINVYAKIPYTVNQSEIIDGLEYRIYAMEGKTEITFVDYTPIEKTFNENYFILDSTSFPQGEYFLDIKLTNGINVKHFKDLIKFKIINNIKNIIL